MLKNYLTIALRNLKQHTLYSAINICGLAVSMASCLLIVLFLQNELSYDTHHTNKESLFRVIDGERAKTPPVLGSVIKEYVPGVRQVTRIIPEYKPLVSVGKRRFYVTRFYRADANIFQTFDFPLLKGDSRTALLEPNTVVITEVMARKFFGDEDPMGKIVRLNNRKDFRVTGILKATSTRSHIQPEFLASLSGLPGQMMTQWFFIAAYTYVVLDEGVDWVETGHKLAKVALTHAGRGSRPKLALQRITDIHLYSKQADDIESNGNMRYLYIFGSIAGLILLIACINYITLSTARSAYRAREVGVRKVFGAKRWQLVGQFLGESVLLSLFALVGAFLLCVIFLPVFNSLFEVSLELSLLHKRWVVAGGLCIALVIGITAGGYSAFILSSFSPLQATGATLRIGTLNVLLRHGLVVIQFVVSIVLIVCTAIVYFQLNYIQKKNLGFDQNQIIEISDTQILKKSRFEAFRNTLLTHSNIQGVSVGNVPGFGSSRKDVHTLEDGSTVVIYNYNVDYDYFDTMGIKFISGRKFLRDHAMDKDAMVVNQRYLGLKSREGQTNIIGVVEDFHMLSLHQMIEPVAIHLKPDSRVNLLVRIASGNIQETLVFLENTWKEFVPEQPLLFAFVDDSLNKLYRAEQKLGEIFFVFAAIAIFIACLGLFGLVAFTAERRTKEIGVRKVLGASTVSVMMLLSKDFIKLVLVANMIGWPIAYWAMRDWLESFYYRIELSLDVFVLSGTLTLLIALLTVSYQAWKAARSNPTDALRYE